MIGTLEQVLSNEAEACFLLGDCVARMGELPAGSVHAVITSPPYWNLIDYEHNDQLGHEELHCCIAALATPQEREQYGMEPCGRCYVCHLVLVWRGIRRVLRADGLWILNVGDSYASGGRGGLKNKDLSLTPFLLARALQLEGCYVRAHLTWLKRNPIPDGAEDRPNKSTEEIFLFSKSPFYFFDMSAVCRESASEPDSPEEYNRKRLKTREKGWDGRRAGEKFHQGATGETRALRTGDLFYDSLEVPHGAISQNGELVAIDTNIQSTHIKHFASYPEYLVDQLVRMSTSGRGACPGCGAQWEPVIDKERVATRPGLDTKTHLQEDGIGNRDPGRHVTKSQVVGWKPGCECYHLPELPAEDCSERDALLAEYAKQPVVPALILDPFSGIATTALVASKLGRRCVGIELNPESLAAGKMRFSRRGKVTKADAAKSKAAAEGKLSGFSSLGLI